LGITDFLSALKANENRCPSKTHLEFDAEGEGACEPLSVSVFDSKISYGQFSLQRELKLKSIYSLLCPISPIFES
jgi:hypothetical protein